VLPFSIALRAGEPIHDQVVYAVTRAAMTGQLRPGDAFPSVRALSQDLKINPNTAHKIVAALVQQGLLEVQAGIGTVVSDGGRGAGAAERRRLLEDDAERFVIDARRMGLTLQDVLTAIRRHWTQTMRRSG
jgi:GntR family transcriptional regulator